MTLIKHSERRVRSACKCCDSNEHYWAHDTDMKDASDGSAMKWCADCGVTGRYVRVDKTPETADLTAGEMVPQKFRHVKVPRRYEDETTTEVHDVTDLPKAPAATEYADTDPRICRFMSLLNPAVDEAQVRRIVAEAVADIVQPVRTVVERANGDVKPVEGLTHTALADVITDLLAGEHVLMVGPAGTGKSTIARQAAESLNLMFAEISLNPGMSATALLGYCSADGTYIRSLFRERYEHGGVFHFDEFDNGHPSTLATINAALANGHMAFPDRMIPKHEDFLCVASANTYGRGADRQYVGRQQIDGATLDRFTVETIEVDEALEQSVCLSTGFDAHKVTNVLEYVRKLRRNAQEHKMTVIVSPRASIGMCRLLHAGKPLDATINAKVRKGMSDSDWNKLRQDVVEPAV